MEMLDEVNKAKELAQKAVDEGDATLSKANETLQTVPEIHQQYKLSIVKILLKLLKN
jgi:hypothetical protein